jgi:hypothetical protein
MYTEAIAAESGLSPEGVAFAFEQSFARELADPDLDALIASVSPAPQVLAILSANVFGAATRALALALAASARVYVRPSRRAPLLPRLLLHAAGLDALLEQPPELEMFTDGMVHAYGSDETLDALRARARVPVWGHGHGFGVALADPALQGVGVAPLAAALARDIVLFDQQGCLSPRVVFVPHAYLSTFACALHVCLEAMSEDVPAGAAVRALAPSRVRYRETQRALGVVYEGRAHLVVQSEALLLGPPARTILVAPWNDAAIAWLAEQAPHLTTVGGELGELGTLGKGDGALGVRLPQLRHTRRAALGEMQRPRLDGPVDRRPTQPALSSEGPPAGPS